jgi:hypothetical protein
MGGALDVIRGIHDHVVVSRRGSPDQLLVKTRLGI